MPIWSHGVQHGNTSLDGHWKNVWPQAPWPVEPLSSWSSSTKSEDQDRRGYAADPGPIPELSIPRAHSPARRLTAWPITRRPILRDWIPEWELYRRNHFGDAPVRMARWPARSVTVQPLSREPAEPSGTFEPWTRVRHGPAEPRSPQPHGSVGPLSPEPAELRSRIPCIPLSRWALSPR